MDKLSLRQYIDFKLYLTRADHGQGACQVSLLPTPEIGESIRPVFVPAESAPNPDLLALLAGKIISLPQLAQLGKQLANCLLPEGTIRELFTQSYRQVENEAGIRLRLIIADHALKQLPWEYVFLNLLDEPDSMRGFLLLDPRLSIVRHEPLPHPHPVIPPSQTDITDLRMVIAAAQPNGLPPLNLDAEIHNIMLAIRDIKVEDVEISSNILIDATPTELQQAMPSPGSAYILHFAGHGTTEITQDWFKDGAEKQQGYILLLSDKTSKAEARIAADDFARLLQGAGVRLAVIGACHSGSRNARYPWDGVAGALAARDIPAVIAMQYEIIDQSAVDFSKMFYFALASGLSLDEAVALGRQAMVRANLEDNRVDVEWGVPVLYSRLPTGAIFPERMARSAAAAEELRTVVEQNIAHITATGKVTGISLEHLEGGNFKVNQKVETVAGELTGIKSESAAANSEINQNLGTVSGNVTGVEITD